MISEGTDIPRLQVCCHMSSVKTELYFRQILGRILRVNSLIDQQAWLFTFAEQSLIEFSERIEQDIPDSCLFTKITSATELEEKTQCIHLNENNRLEERDETNSELAWGKTTNVNTNSADAFIAIEELRLGAFKQRVISAFLATS